MHSYHISQQKFPGLYRFIKYRKLLSKEIFDIIEMLSDPIIAKVFSESIFQLYFFNYSMYHIYAKVFELITTMMFLLHS